MEKLLYLVHRIPYPPNKGDKIRSFNWLKGLSRQFEIYLGTFIDDVDDEQYVEELSRYCKAVHVARLNPGTAKLKSLSGLLSGKALTLPYYYNAALGDWVRQTIVDHKIDKALVFSSSMAQYLDAQACDDMIKVIDFVDVDSDKWRQYAEARTWPANAIYAREARKLFEYEAQTARRYKASVFVSEAESRSFGEMIGDNNHKITYANNGVDCDYFSPDTELTNPFEIDAEVVTFTGAMDYWANVDAVMWFAKEVFPALRKQRRHLQFYIVGSKPTPEVQALSTRDGITVTGRVEDVRPYIKYAGVCVAPMRIARGIQNKVLEAMAMARPVVASPQGFEGISAIAGSELVIADGVEEYVLEISTLLQDDRGMGVLARMRVMHDYTWSAAVDRLVDLLGG
jgi:sugar transferase (PEP-CTERM/EpsH1 system associated)